MFQNLNWNGHISPPFGPPKNPVFVPKHLLGHDQRLMRLLLGQTPRDQGLQQDQLRPGRDIGWFFGGLEPCQVEKIWWSVKAWKQKTSQLIASLEKKLSDKSHQSKLIWPFDWTQNQGKCCGWTPFVSLRPLFGDISCFGLYANNFRQLPNKRKWSYSQHFSPKTKLKNRNFTSQRYHVNAKENCLLSLEPRINSKAWSNRWAPELRVKLHGWRMFLNK